MRLRAAVLGALAALTAACGPPSMAAYLRGAAAPLDCRDGNGVPQACPGALPGPYIGPRGTMTERRISHYGR